MMTMTEEKKTPQPQRKPLNEGRITHDHAIEKSHVRQDSEKADYVSSRVPDEKGPPKK
jgi:hypothetical protein